MLDAVYYLHTQANMHTHDMDTYVRTHHMHTCINACMHVCMHMYMHAYMHTYTRMHAYIHTYMSACMFAYVHAHIQALSCMHACIHTYMLTCIHACIHGYMPAYTCICMHACLLPNRYIHTCCIHIGSHVLAEGHAAWKQGGFWVATATVFRCGSQGSWSMCQNTQTQDILLHWKVCAYGLLVIICVSTDFTIVAFCTGYAWAHSFTCRKSSYWDMQIVNSNPCAKINAYNI